MAAKIKVIELAKELGVTSKDLMVTAEEMGHKSVRAMTPLDLVLANALRVKLGKGRELPEAPVKPKRVGKPKAAEEAGVDGAAATKPAPRARKPKTAEVAEEAPAEVKPAATIVKPKPAPIEPALEPLVAAAPASENVPEPLGGVPPAP
ncbi:MAG: translation initiation factor IF-2 N-terminal domain-containing protein, partial [Candidatus Rokuibacteriota bacterium]